MDLEFTFFLVGNFLRFQLKLNPIGFAKLRDLYILYIPVEYYSITSVPMDMDTKARVVAIILLIIGLVVGYFAAGPGTG